MNKNNFYISFGVWLVIIPLLGVPIVWRDALVFLSGLFLLLVSFGPTILKKLQPKVKNKNKKELPNEELRFSEKEATSSPALPLGAGEGREEGI